MEEAHVTGSTGELAEACAKCTLYFICIFMVLCGFSLQLYLLRLRSSHLSLKPTEGELFCFTAVAWFLHLVASKVAQFVLDSIIVNMHGEAMFMEYLNLRANSYSLHQTFGMSTAWTLLAYQIALAWVTSLALAFALDHGYPFLLSLNRDPYEACVTLSCRIAARANELRIFHRQFEQHEATVPMRLTGWANRLFTTNRYDISRLQRRLTVSGTGNRARRNLEWKFTVSEVALRGLKDTLRRIGHFGEHGFHFSGNAVIFEASGSGCTVKIIYDMEDPRLAGHHVDDNLN